MKKKNINAAIWMICLTWLLGLASIAQADLVFVKQNSSPKYFEQGSERLGLCDDFYIRLKGRLQQKGIASTIDPSLYPIKRVLGMVESGKAHAFCGAGRNKEREKKYIYSKHPIYYVSNVILSHKDDDYVAQDYDMLNRDKLMIGVFYGTSSARFLKKYEGLHVIDKYTDLQQALNDVAEKKVPYFYYHDLGLSYLVENTNLPVKLMPKRLRTIPQWVLYSRSLSEAQVALLDKTMGDMVAEGVIAEINEPFIPETLGFLSH